MRRRADAIWDATEARRLELGKKWKHVLAETGLSYQTLNVWRKGRNVDPLTDLAFTKSLHWAPGARDAIAEGRDPTPLEPEQRDEPAEDPRVEGPPDDPRVRAVLDILDSYPPEVEQEVLRRRGGRIVVPPEEAGGEPGGELHAG